MTNILIVEDNAILRGLLREWLSTELPECRFLEAASGEAAVEAGVYAYVPKRNLQAQLLPAVRELLSAETYPPEQIQITEAHSDKGL